MDNDLPASLRPLRLLMGAVFHRLKYCAIQLLAHQIAALLAAQMRLAIIGKQAYVGVLRQRSVLVR